MNKKLIAGLVSLLALSLPCMAGLSSGEKDAVLAAPNGTSSGGSLTTTIDLNDASDTEIRNYYSSLSSLSEEERKGNNLLKNLKGILKNMYYFSYGNLWKIYEITDRNWDLSPASGTTYGTYDAENNKITNYQYGSSNTNGRNNPYVRAVYRDDSEAGRVRAWGDHGVTGINREHLWPQSRGFKDSDEASGPAGTDLHHLVAADAKVNQAYHNNNPYGNVDKSTASESTDYTYIPGNYLGGGLFEPADQYKGDIARALFYMAARYNNWSGETGAISEFEPFLEITNEAYTNDTVTSSDTQSATMGILHDLLEWHEEDPVDEFEIHRNNLIYNNYQENRNPFIDFPEWVGYVWGTSENVGVSTGSASPNTDSINEYSLSLNSSSLSLEEGETATITVSSNNPLSTFAWSISDASIASISSTQGESITVTALKEGNAAITVSDDWRNEGSASCSITVTPKKASSSTSEPSSSSSTSTPAPSGNIKEGFVKCESVADVTSGTYIIAANASDSWAAASPTLETNKLNKIDVSGLSSGIVQTGAAIDIAALSFTVDNSDASTDPKVYIQNEGGEYLSHTSKNSTNLSFRSNSYYWLLSSVSSKGSFRLTSTATDSAHAILFRSGTEYNVFKAYKYSNVSSGSAYYDLELFRLADASEFAVSFMDKTGEVCVSDGSTNVDSLKTVWSTLSSEYSALSSEAKAVLKSSEVTDDYILNALERYRFIVKKYSSSYDDINNFMDLAIQNVYHPLDADSLSNGHIIFIVIGTIFITATSLFIFKKSKKEN